MKKTQENFLALAQWQSELRRAFQENEVGSQLSLKILKNLEHDLERNSSETKNARFLRSSEAGRGRGAA